MNRRDPSRTKSFTEKAGGRKARPTSTGGRRARPTSMVRPTSMATADERKKTIRAFKKETGGHITQSERERVLKILEGEVGGK